jgi:hypothetical protein
MWLRVTLLGLCCVASPCAASEAPRTPTRLSFYGFDGASDGIYSSFGFERATEAGLDARGAVIRAVFGSGLSRYRTGEDRALVLENTISARILGGWRQAGSWGIATIFVGLGVEYRRLQTTEFAGLGPTGLKIGPAIAIDSWLTPWPKIAVQAQINFSTAQNAASVRLAPGYEWTEGSHVGIETIWSTHHESSRFKLGPFIAGGTPFGFDARLSGGLTRDPGGRSGFYASFAIWKRN